MWDVIRFQAVSKRYGRWPGRRNEALRALDLRVRPGELVALVGRNGAGKSTVLGLTLGFLRASEGRVRVGGEAPRTYVRGHGAGYLPENFSPPGQLRADRVLLRLALLDGLDRAAARRSVREALARAGLEGSGRRRVKTLSRGNRQRLALAQLLLRSREVLLLDEPWGGLDPGGRSRLREILGELRRERPGAAMIVASHDLGQVARVADRAVVLDEGRAVDRVRLGRADDAGDLERRVLECGVGAGRGRAERDGRRAPPRVGGAG